MRTTVIEWGWFGFGWGTIPIPNVRLGVVFFGCTAQSVVDLLAGLNGWRDALRQARDSVRGR